MTLHKLLDLPYAYDALEPFIDAKTMEIHHSKHHQTYINNLNAALEKTSAEIQKAPLDMLLMDLAIVPETVREAVRNNAGGHMNHTIFWKVMGKNRGGKPLGDVGAEIMKEFGTWENFKDKMKSAALSRFGSGWAWLSLNKEGKLFVHSTANQDNPLSDGHKPIFGIDVWEHAYYLKYQNKRADYIDAWWNLIDWETVNERYMIFRNHM